MDWVTSAPEPRHSAELISVTTMPRILISNIDNESMLADERALTLEFCRSSSITAGRMAWFAEPGDIVVLPRDLSAPLKDYIARIKGYEPGAVTYMTPDWDNGPCRPIRAHELLHTGLAERLAARIGDPRDWTLYPYCYERGTQQLAERLKLDGERNAKPFVQQGGAELLNDKRVFRSLAAGRGISIAQGAVCASQWELTECIESLIDVTGTVIVKQDRHSGGFGNLIVSRSDASDVPGAPEVLRATDAAAVRDQAAIVWTRLAYAAQAPLIVEVYYAVSAAVTAEFKVDPARNAVTFLNCGEVRQAPILSGLIMPSAIPAYRLAGFIASATELARLCCDLGYEGLVNVDGILTEDGEVIINEINGRVGGCSHIHHILEAVAGPRYGDELVVVSHSSTVSMVVEEAFGILDERKLAFDAAAQRGIVITGEDTAQSGLLEYLSIAPTRDEAMRLETAFESILTAGASDEGRSGIEHLARILWHMPRVQPAASDEAARALGNAARKP